MPWERSTLGVIGLEWSGPPLCERVHAPPRGVRADGWETGWGYSAGVVEREEVRVRTELAGRVGVAFTDRHGGVSAAPYDTLNLGGGVGDDPAAVAENRRRAALAIGADPGRVVFMRQVHSSRVAYVRDPAESWQEVDAVVTDVPGLALAALAADCAPVLLADPEAGLVGAAHSGRNGTLGGVVPALVEAMVERGGRSGRMTALIGPAICGACYEVPEEMQRAALAVLPETKAVTREGTPALDLRAGVVAQLAAAGVRDVRRDPRCTREDEALFSHRRDGRSGRLAGYVWLAS
ncbi:MAG: peptidoglycan editing factor PgeF [Streptosporangiales bacterium]|nr:peptidoglycan editing factor PgeF [Streptosporangiales bacterium]